MIDPREMHLAGPIRSTADLIERESMSRCGGPCGCVARLMDARRQVADAWLAGAGIFQAVVS